MESTGGFIFGSKLLEETRHDPIASLPLELSWKIFLYLDEACLRDAIHVNKTWNRIIYTHKTLQRRLNQFELALKLGSRRLARFYKRNKKLLKKVPVKNYLPTREQLVESKKEIIKVSKRGGDNLVICTKRFKIF